MKKIKDYLQEKLGFLKSLLSKKVFLFLPFVVFLLSLILVFVYKDRSLVADQTSTAYKDNVEDDVDYEDFLPIEEEEELEGIEPMEYFNRLPLIAESALVWDIKNEEFLFEKNANTVRPLASLVKIMTAVVALDQMSPDFVVEIGYDSHLQYGYSGLYLNEKWRLEDLVKISLMTSVNDSSHAIATEIGHYKSGLFFREAENYFVSLMNNQAQEIGLSNMFFYNSTGLDIGESSGGAYGAPVDVLKMGIYAFFEYPEVMSSTRYVSMERVSLNNYQHSFVNTNPLVSDTGGILFSKTGYTDLAGGNLLMIININLNHPVAVLVMGSTFEGRFRDVENLIDATDKYLRSI